MLGDRCLGLQEDFNNLDEEIDDELDDIRDEVLFEENKNRVKIDTENLKNMRTKQIRKTYKETSEFIIPKVEILKEL